MMARVARAGCIRASLLLGLCWALRAVAVGAEARHFDVPAGLSGQRIEEFIAQSGMEVLYDKNLSGDCSTQAVHGDLEPRQALGQLLQGSGLIAVFTAENSASVRSRSTGDHCGQPLSSPSRSESSVHHPDPASHATDPVDASAMKEVLIAVQQLGRELQVEPGVEVIRYSATDLERLGVVNTGDWLRTLPGNSGTGPNEDPHGLGRETATNIGFGVALNLHDLGSRATLVLVDGHRLAPSGSAGAFTDVGNIPLSAIDHIDVLTSGASALYGADAIGGIVNFVMRDDTAAPESHLSLGGLTLGDPRERQLSQSWRTQWDTGGGRLALEYYERDALWAADRGRATSDLLPWGGGNWGTPAGNPGTLMDGHGGVWAIPTGQDGTALKTSDLIAGTENLYNRFQGSTLLPHQERVSLIAFGKQRLGEDTTVWIDTLLSRRRFAAQAPGLTTVLTVPSSNPWYVNPGLGNQVQVEYGFGRDLGRVSEDGRVDSGQAVVGFTRQRLGRWSIAGYLSSAIERQIDVDGNLVNFGALQSALDSADRSVAFNPFGDGSHTNPATLAAIRSQGTINYNSAITAANFTAVGPLSTLPTGDLVLTLGADYREQALKSSIRGPITFATTPSTNDSRRMFAVFAQSKIPIVGRGAAEGGPDRLDLVLSVRDEHYSDAGTIPAPRAGLAYSPNTSVTLHTDWARLYRAPNLPDLSETANTSAIIFLPDSKNPGGSSNVLAWTGGNAGLRPESADSWTTGVQVHPPSHPDALVSLTYFNVIFDNQIQTFQLPLNALTDPTNNWLVSRDPTVAQRTDVCRHSQFAGVPDDCLNQSISAIVDVRLHNAQKLKTDGLDLDSRYGWDLPVGHMGVRLTATYVLRYAQADTPTSALTQLRDTAHNPIALRLHTTFGWEHHGWWASVGVNYQGGYTNTDVVPYSLVRPWTTWDMALGIPVSDGEGSSPLRMQIVVRSQNVFNASPPFMNNAAEGTSYDEENATLLGRRASIEFSVRW